MKKSIIILMLATTALFSCNQGSKSALDTVDTETSDSVNNVPSQPPLTNYNDKHIYTQYEYTDALGFNLIIQNSFPKGGLKYTAPNGKEYIYLIFWTRIINQTANPFELTINFPEDLYALPSSPAVHFKILLPPDTMTVDTHLYNYGLTNLESFLDNNFHKPSSLERTINPKEASGFYVILLSEKGVNGTVRTGLSLKEQNLFYSINDREIHCGYLDTNLGRFTKNKTITTEN